VPTASAVTYWRRTRPCSTPLPAEPLSAIDDLRYLRFLTLRAAPFLERLEAPASRETPESGRALADEPAGRLPDATS
jgi:hypothetical protein